MPKRLNIELGFKADTSQAKTAIQDLYTQLQKINTVAIGGNVHTKEYEEAAKAAKELQYHLSQAYNANTGNLDLSKLNSSLKKSSTNASELGSKLLGAGAEGKSAFLSLAKSISAADYPMFKLNSKLSEMMTVLKNSARWQLSSTMLHGFTGAISNAYRYAQDLNKSLTNISIVTGKSTSQMAQFAKQANEAAHSLSTTTTNYTDSSLIYFQQGLSEEEVKARTDVTIKMANASGQAAETVANQMTAIWNNFAKGADNLEHFGDVLTKLGAETASSSSEIATGMEKFASVADVIGLSYENAAAALATVTATTRQSAEVVGTAFRTIFARIQGLKLGETLEDGTDMNKYSNALASAGVQIKTQNGQLKEMDDILDDLGNKWKLLTKDQQVALAQTVGGTRQWQQLVSLLDNYDYYQENVARANNADGSLTAQSERYEEGWAAATYRIKASLEELYDTLIDDQFFIKLTNTLDTAVKGVTNLINHLGGVPGVIATIGSLILGLFADKIGPAIRNQVDNIRTLFTGTQVQVQKMVNDFAKASAELQSKKGVNGEDAFSATEKQEIQNYSDLAAVRARLAAVSKDLNQEETTKAQLDIQGIELTQKSILKSTQEVEALKDKVKQLEEVAEKTKEIDEYSKTAKTVRVNDLSEDAVGTIQERIDANDNLRDDPAQWQMVDNALSEVLDHYLANLSALQESLGTVEQCMLDLANTQPNTEEYEGAIKSLQNAYDEYLDSLIEVQSQEEFRANIATSLGVDMNDSSVFQEMIKEVDLFYESIKDVFGGKVPEQVRKAYLEIVDAMDAGNIDDYTGSLKQLKSAMGDYLKTLKPEQAEKMLKSFDPKYLEANKKAQDQVTKATKEHTAATEKLNKERENLNKNIKDFDPHHTMTAFEGIIRAASTIGTTVSIVHTLNSALSVTADESATAGEKIMAWVQAFAFGAPQVISLLKQVGTTFKELSTTETLTTILRGFGDNSIFSSMADQIDLAEKAMSSLGEASERSGAAYDLLIKGLDSYTTNIDKMDLSLAKSIITSELDKGATLEEAYAKAILESATDASGKKLDEETAKKYANIVATKALTSATLGLKVAMGAAIVVIAAAAAAVAIYLKNQEKIKQAAQDSAKESQKNIEKSREEIKTITELFEKYEEAKDAYDGSIAAKQELNTATENIVKALDLEWNALDRIQSKYEDVNKAIYDNIEAKYKDQIEEERKNINSNSDNALYKDSLGDGDWAPGVSKDWEILGDYKIDIASYFKNTKTFEKYKDNIRTFINESVNLATIDLTKFGDDYFKLYSFYTEFYNEVMQDMDDLDEDLAKAIKDNVFFKQARKQVIGTGEKQTTARAFYENVQNSLQTIQDLLPDQIVAALNSEGFDAAKITTYDELQEYTEQIKKYLKENNSEIEGLAEDEIEGIIQSVINSFDNNIAILQEHTLAERLKTYYVIAGESIQDAEKYVQDLIQQGLLTEVYGNYIPGENVAQTKAKFPQIKAQSTSKTNREIAQTALNDSKNSDYSIADWRNLEIDWESTYLKSFENFIKLDIEDKKIALQKIILDANNDLIQLASNLWEYSNEQAKNNVESFGEEQAARLKELEDYFEMFFGEDGLYSSESEFLAKMEEEAQKGDSQAKRDVESYLELLTLRAKRDSYGSEKDTVVSSISQESKDLQDYAASLGIAQSELIDFENAYENYQNMMNSEDATQEQVDAAKKTYDLEYKRIDVLKNLANAANKYNLSQKDLITYANSLIDKAKEEGTLTEDLIDKIGKRTEAYYKAVKGAEDLTTAIDNYNKATIDGTQPLIEGSPEWVSNLESIKSAIGLITNTDTDLIDDEYVKALMLDGTTLQEIISGNKDALTKMITEVKESALAKANAAIKDSISDIQASMDNLRQKVEDDMKADEAWAIIKPSLKDKGADLKKECADLWREILPQVPDIILDADIDTTEFYEKIIKLAADAGLAVEDINNILSKLGVTDTVKEIRDGAAGAVDNKGSFSHGGRKSQEALEQLGFDDLEANTERTTIIIEKAELTEDQKENQRLKEKNAELEKTIEENNAAHAEEIENIHANTDALVAEIRANYADKNKNSSGSSKDPTINEVQGFRNWVDVAEDLNKQLDKTNDELSDLEKKEERLTGGNRLQAQREQNKLLQQKRDLYVQLQKEQKNSLATTQEELQAMAAQSGLSFNFLSEEEGYGITNYETEMRKLWEQYVAAENEANAMTDAESQDEFRNNVVNPLKEKLDKLDELYEDYYASIENIRDTGNELYDTISAIQDNNYKQITTKLDYGLEITALEMKEIDYYVKKIDDDFYSMGEAAALYLDKIPNITSDLSAYESQFNEAQQLVKTGDISQEQYLEALKSSYEGILDNLEALQELDQKMLHYYEDTLNKATEELKKYTDQMDHLTKVLEHYKDIVELMDGEYNYQAIGTILEGLASTKKDKLDVAKANYELLKSEEEYMKAQLDSYEQGSAAWELYKEAYDAAVKKTNEAEEEMLSATKEWAEAMKDIMMNTFASAAYEMEMAFTNGMGFDYLNNSLDRLSKYQDEYLTKTNQIYETEKLMRRAQMDSDKVSSAATKARLANFIKETQELQDKNEMSQLDLKIQKAKYELLLAEIALEDAQNAKSTVRLQRDNEGNFGYVYTADADALANAEQDLADKQNDLYNIGLEATNDYGQKLLQLQQDLSEKLQQLEEDRANGRFATEEQYYMARDQLLREYNDLFRAYSEQYTTGLEVDSRIQADAWINAYQDMVYETEDWKDKTTDYTLQCEEAYTQWRGTVEAESEVVDRVLNNTAEEVNKVTEKSRELKDTVLNEVIPAIDEELEQVHDSLQLYANQRQAILDLIASYEELARSIKEAAQAQMDFNGLDDGTYDVSNVKDYSLAMANYLRNGGKEDDSYYQALLAARNVKMQNSKWSSWSDDSPEYNELMTKYKRYVANGESNDLTAYVNSVLRGEQFFDPEEIKKLLMRFGTGGYTGSWGPGGKLAILDEKELVLNADDTQKMLDIIGMVRDIAQVIDSGSLRGVYAPSVIAPSLGSDVGTFTTEQSVKIEASFPAVQDRSQIEEAFNNLINTASQYANRR